MRPLEMKTSPKLVQQVAAIERFAGAWDRLALSEAVASESLMRGSLRRGAIAATTLDVTATHTLLHSLEAHWSPAQPPLDGRPPRIHTAASPVADRALTGLVEAHLVPAEFDEEGLLELFHLVSGESEAEELRGVLRRINGNFCAPGLGGDGDEIVFPTISTFLVEQRLAELLEWTRHELAEGSFHPLFIAGVFHLLFLQIHPFRTANHRLAMVLLWRILDAHGYGFVRYQHFSEEFARKPKPYFSALRQAERSSLGSWSTLNVWLEFFLDSLIQTSEHLIHRAEQTVNISQLTTVQRRIIDVVRANGAVTREKIVTETGINISTVKYNLSVLASRGHLKRDGGGRTTSYRIL